MNKDPLHIAQVKFASMEHRAKEHRQWAGREIAKCKEAATAQPDALPKPGTKWQRRNPHPDDARAAGPRTVTRYKVEVADQIGGCSAWDAETFHDFFEPLPDEPEQAQRKWVVMRLDNRDRPFVSAQTDSSVSRAEAERIAREAQGRLGPGVIYWAAPEPAEEVSP